MKKFFALVLCLTALLCTALAEDTTPIYTEDFEDGVHDIYVTENCAPECIAEVRTDDDGNSYLHCVTNTGEGENGYVQIAFGPNLRNFDYTVRVRPYIKNGDYNWMKIVLRGLDGHSGDGYENESYLFNIWEWRGCFVIKSTENRQSESTILVENQDFWFDNDTWYTIRVEARETNIKVYVDGELCVEYTDEKDLRPDGIFGLCSWGVNFDVDDICIISYDDPNAVTTESATVETETTEVAFDGNMLPLIQAEAGIVEHHDDGSVRIAGRNADNTGDGYTDTWHILQRKVSDFELSFDYTPALVEWNMDRVCFRCAGDENGWNQYQLLLFGSNHDAGTNGLRIVKGEAMDNPFAYYECSFEEGKTYEFKLVVKGNNVKVYMDDALVIDVDLPTAETEEYRDEYIAEGDFQFISWAGDFTMTHLDLVELPNE